MSQFPLKKIWILNHHAATPEQGWGTRHYDIAKGLAERGYEVTVFASSYLHVSESYIFEENVKIEEYSGFKFVWLKTTPAYIGNGTKRIMNMISYVRQVLRITKTMSRPDVVVGSSVHPFAWLAAERLANRYQAVYLAEIRDLWPQTFIDVGAIFKHHPVVYLFRLIEKRMFKKADGIISLLPNVAQYLKERGIKRTITVISNGVDIEKFDENRVQTPLQDSESLGVVLKKYQTCLYVGSLAKSEGIDTILDAAKQLIDRGLSTVRIVIIGDGTEKSRLMKYAQDHNLENVIFKDRIGKEAVPAVLSGGTLLLISLLDRPIYRYGISLNKLFDYMAAGRPIVFAGNVSQNPVEKAECGVCVAAEDPYSMADAMENLLKLSPIEQAEMGDRGRTYLEKHYSMDQIVDQYIDAITQGAEAKGSPERIEKK